MAHLTPTAITVPALDKESNKTRLTDFETDNQSIFFMVCYNNLFFPLSIDKYGYSK